MSDIADRLVGKEVVVFMKEGGEPKLKKFAGKIAEAHPPNNLIIDHGTGTGGSLCFAGWFEGIHTIVDSTGKVLYHNDAVLLAYEKGPVKEPFREDNLPEVEERLRLLRSLGHYHL
ncbi:MAG: hypothetical protein KJ574_00500 [Nanoarchaeota archaeon]|nr:hypothetical protein [Nanoarchaeota archaeon]